MAAHRARAMPVTGGFVPVCSCEWFDKKTTKANAQLIANDHTYNSLVDGASTQLQLEPAAAPVDPAPATMAELETRQARGPARPQGARGR